MSQDMVKAADDLLAIVERLARERSDLKSENIQLREAVRCLIEELRISRLTVELMERNRGAIATGDRQ
jgi:hypothetical protein